MENIKENIIPTLTENQKQYVYANEADIQLVILENLENLNAEMINQGIA